MATVKEVGSTGLAEWSGYIQEDFLRELRGTDGYKRFNEMRLNSPTVGSILLAIEQAIRGMTMQLVSEEGEEDPRLEVLEQSWERIDWNAHLSEALTMLPFGFSLFEIVYKRGENGAIIWDKFSPRGQDTVSRWVFDDKHVLTGFEQVAAPNYVPVVLPVERLVHYKARSEKDNPEGRSILRTAWIPYYYLKNIQQIEAIGIERDLAGLPVIKLPEGADTGDNETSDLGRARKVVRNIRNDEQAGIVLPAGWEIVLLSTGGSRQFDTSAIVRRYQSDILMSTLTQFLLLGQSQVGTQALSKDQTDFFAMAVNSIADIITETLTKQAIEPLLRLNGFDAYGIRVEHTTAGDVDLSVLADFLQKTGSLITWLPSDEIWLRNVARLPEVDEDVIEEAKAEREAKALAIQANIKQAQGQKQDKETQKDNAEDVQEDEDEEEDELTARFAAMEGEDERRLWERRYRNLWATFLTDQQARVVKAARSLQR